MWEGVSQAEGELNFHLLHLQGVSGSQSPTYDGVVGKVQREAEQTRPRVPCTAPQQGGLSAKSRRLNRIQSLIISNILKIQLKITQTKKIIA